MRVGAADRSGKGTARAAGNRPDGTAPRVTSGPAGGPARSRATAPSGNSPQLPLFYRKVVPLSRERHGRWYIDPEPGYRFARETNSVYVAAVEFPPVAREYPIVFAQGPGKTALPVALLGMRHDENLFVTEDGRWDASYVPAYVRRYPFILAVDPQAQTYTVCIDEAYSGFNLAQEGERLIAEDGSHGPLLARSVEFLRDYQQQVQATDVFCRTLVELDVLEPMQANMELAGGEKLTLAGFSCVSKERLRRVAGERLQELVARNLMDLVYAHLLSLGNLARLLERVQARKRAAAGG